MRAERRSSRGGGNKTRKLNKTLEKRGICSLAFQPPREPGEIHSLALRQESSPVSLLMHRGISLHMTSRNKGLLEDVVSGLWELESARRRQERLVHGVLAPGDTDREHETLKWQQVSTKATSASGFSLTSVEINNTWK